MAGIAFLPWEEWLARLLHPVYVALRKRMYSSERRRDLARSQGWPESEGTIHQILMDTSLPREGLLYSFSCGMGYYSGSYWRWLKRSEAREVKTGDHILLRYNSENPDDSVFVRFQESDSSVAPCLHSEKD